MSQKRMSMTDDQKASIRNAKLDPLWWKVLRDLPTSLMIVNRATGEVKIIDKVKPGSVHN